MDDESILELLEEWERDFLFHLDMESDFCDDFGESELTLIWQELEIERLKAACDGRPRDGRLPTRLVRMLCQWGLLEEVVGAPDVDGERRFRLTGAAFEFVRKHLQYDTLVDHIEMRFPRRLLIGESAEKESLKSNIPTISEAELSEARKLFQQSSTAPRQAVMDRLGIGAAKATAILKIMRSEGLCTSKPRTGK